MVSDNIWRRGSPQNRLDFIDVLETVLNVPTTVPTRALPTVQMNPIPNAILVDEAYEDANRHAATLAGRFVKRRFAEVYGADAVQVLTDIEQRMESNIRSDGRSESLAPGRAATAE